MRISTGRYVEVTDEVFLSMPTDETHALLVQLRHGSLERGPGVREVPVMLRRLIELLESRVG